MSKELDGKVVVITGGAGGIGSSMARAFARSGAKVVIASRSMEKLNIVAKEIEAQGQTCLAITCDVTDADQVNRMVDETIKSLGGLDVLVNNAGSALFVKPPGRDKRRRVACGHGSQLGQRVFLLQCSRKTYD